MSDSSAVAPQQGEHSRLLSNIRDYSRAVNTLTWQRQSIFTAISILTGFFFDPWKAALFYSVCMGCEYVDLLLARRVGRIRKDNPKATRLVFSGYVVNTIISTLAVSIYAVWVGVTEDGVGIFTALFCLFAAALYAAMNNHQIVSLLAIRLTLYGVSFLVITVSDLWQHRPPLSSDMWLQFFTVIFVMYFLIDCSLGFLRMYRQDLKRLEDLELEHERAKAALVLKSQFVAVVSHELRTPLTSIKGSLDLINSGKFGQMPPQAQFLLGLAGKNSRRLAELVDDLLDLQKLEEGKMRFEKKPVEMRAFVAEATNSYQGLAERYDVTIAFDAGGTEPVFVHTDPARLMQVFGNILSNAAKFSHEKADVEIWLAVTDDRVRIFIRDHGVGIPEGSKDEVFGRFTQVDTSDQRKFGGTGLGMNISREIVEALGGAIDYESELGVGTTFFIELPRIKVLESSLYDGTVDSSNDDTETEEFLSAS